MTTNVAQVLPPARQDPRQVLNTLKMVVNWNDANIANGNAFDNALPRNAFITDVLVEIVTPFNGTTPALTVGTVGTAYNNIVAAGDVDETVAGVTRVTRAIGRGLTAAADIAAYAKAALTGASAGQAVIVITFEGGWAS